MKTNAQLVPGASVVAFKRLAIGDTFSTTRNGACFRKASSKAAFALLENGRGQTNTVVRFTRSVTCFFMRFAKAAV